MSYLDRLEKLGYQSPKRKVFTLLFDEVSRSQTKKVAINEFPYQDEANVQDLGNANLKIPITCYINGPNYDREADRFWKSLNEPGAGILDHPRWGSIDVIPISYSQTEKFVDGMGFATFAIEFVQYFEDAASFPSSLFNQIAGLVDAVIGAIDSILTIETQVRRTIRNAKRLQGSVISETNRIKARSQGVASSIQGKSKSFLQKTADARNSLNAAVNKFNRNIDSLVSQPAQLLRETIGLLRVANRIQASILQKVQTYSDIISDISKQFAEPGAVFSDYEANIQGYMAVASGLALAESTTEGGIATRNEAISILEKLTSIKLLIQNINDTVSTFGGSLDYEVVKQILLTISRAQRILLDSTLTLPSERVVILEKDTTPIQFVYELTGSIDRLDELMNYNRFISNAILMIPKGTNVRYY